MIETAMESILLHAKKKKKLKLISTNPLGKIDAMKQIFKKDKVFLEIIEFYEMLRKIEELRTERIGEFRKNVNLKIFYQGKEIDMNLEELKIRADRLEKFISTVKQFLLS